MIRRVVILSAVLAFFLRLYIIFNSQLTFYSDDAIYVEIARFWSQGRLSLVFHPTWPPFFPFLTFITSLLSFGWENSARIVSAISASILVIPFYFLGKKFLSPVPALIMSLFVNFLVPVFKISVFPQSDMLATDLLISAITLFIYKRFNLSSAFFGLTYLTRSEGLMFFGLSLVFLILIERKLKTVFLFLLTFFIIISPYMVATKIETGSFSLSQKAAAQIKQGQAFQLIKGTTWIQEIVSVKNPNYKSAYFKGALTHVLEYSDWFIFWFGEKLGVWKSVIGVAMDSYP